MTSSKWGLCWAVFLCALAITSGHSVEASGAAGESSGWLQTPEEMDPRDLQVLAILYIEQNQAYEAIPLLERAVDLYPENGETYMWLGVAEFLTEQFPKAEESFMKALARNPSLTEVRNYLGLMRSKQGDINAAMREFLLALRDPVYPPESKARVRLNLGNLYLETNQPELAREQLTEAVAAVPSRTDQVYQPLHLQLAKSLIGLDRTQEAIAALTKVIEVNEENIEAHLQLGFAHRDLGQRRVAREHFERVIQLAPGTELSERAQAALARMQG